MDAAFCVDAWEAALRSGRAAPLISNTDQGSQFTSPMFLDAVQSAGVKVSMDGRGRWMDNRFIERLWRSVKYEDIYLQDYGGGLDAGRGIGKWFDRYNQERPHQALGYATVAEERFLNEVIVHFHLGWQLAKRGSLLSLQTMEEDAKTFFSLAFAKRGVVSHKRWARSRIRPIH